MDEMNLNLGYNVGQLDEKIQNLDCMFRQLMDEKNLSLDCIVVLLDEMNQSLIRLLNFQLMDEKNLSLDCSVVLLDEMNQSLIRQLNFQLKDDKSVMMDVSYQKMKKKIRHLGYSVVHVEIQSLILLLNYQMMGEIPMMMYEILIPHRRRQKDEILILHRRHLMGESFQKMNLRRHLGCSVGHGPELQLLQLR
jgi:hypothetical protein